MIGATTVTWWRKDPSSKMFMVALLLLCISACGDESDSGHATTSILQRSYLLQGTLNGQSANGELIVSPPDGRIGLNTLNFDVTTFRMSSNEIELRGTGTIEVSTIYQRNISMDTVVQAPRQVKFPLRGGGIGTLSFPVVFQEITLTGGGYVVAFSATPN